MKKTLLLLGLALITVGASAQNTKEEKHASLTTIGALDVREDSDAGRVLKLNERVADELPAERPSAEVENRVFDVVEQMPGFPGGISGLSNYLKENLRYPPSAMKDSIQGRVIVSFVVEKDGTISEAKIARGADPRLDAEALRVIRAMPKWTPGRQNGQGVRVKYNVPITFRLS